MEPTYIFWTAVEKLCIFWNLIEQWTL